MKVYITGGTGLVGSNLIKVAREKYNAQVVSSLYGPRPTTPIDYTLDELDLRDKDAVISSIGKAAPDVVIHSAALLDLPAMMRDHQLAWSMMVDATRNVIEGANKAGARVIFISSDWVFDGYDAQPATEDTPPCPVNYYGILKVVGETLINTMAINGAVARIAGVYGVNWAIPAATRWQYNMGYGDLVNAVLAQLRAKEAVNIWVKPGYVNDAGNPSLASDCSDMVLRLAETRLNGIFHCCGSEAMRRVDVAHAVADVFGLDGSLISETEPDSAAIEELDKYRIRTPYQGRMDTKKTSEKLNRTAFNVLDGLRAFKEELALSGL